MSSSHTIFPTYIPDGFFCKDNLSFIQNMITHVLKREFSQNVIISEADIKKVMQRVMGERMESVPKMNQRVIMYITNEFRDHQLDVNKHLRWDENKHFAETLYDPISCNLRADPYNVKLSNRFGRARVGGTARFYFT